MSMMHRALRVTALSLIASQPLAAQKSAVDLSKVRMLDLSHPYNARTLFWPTSPTKFKLDTVSYGQNPGGWFYSAFMFSAPDKDSDLMKISCVEPRLMPPCVEVSDSTLRSPPNLPDGAR